MGKGADAQGTDDDDGTDDRTWGRTRRDGRTIWPSNVANTTLMPVFKPQTANLESIDVYRYICIHVHLFIYIYMHIYLYVCLSIFIH